MESNETKPSSESGFHNCNESDGSSVDISPTNKNTKRTDSAPRCAVLTSALSNGSDLAIMTEEKKNMCKRMNAADSALHNVMASRMKNRFRHSHASQCM